jgi:hypothetical protein
MTDDKKHTMRLALLLAFMVVMLVSVSINKFVESDNNMDQQASVLHVYAR